MTLPASAQQSRKTLGTLLTVHLALACVMRFTVLLYPPAHMLQSHLFGLLPVMLLIPVLAIPGVRRQFGLKIGACIAVWTAVTCLCTTFADSDLYTVVTPFYLTLVFLFVTCYSIPFALGGEQTRRTFHLVAAIFVVLMTALCCVALYAAVTDTVIPNPGGSIYQDACVSSHRLMMFCSSVATGSYACITVFLCLLLLLDKPRPALRVLCLICIPFAYIAAAISDARIPIVCIAVCIGGLVWLLATGKLPIKRTFVRTVVSFALAGVVILAFYFGTVPCIRAMNTIRAARVAAKATASVSQAATPSKTAVPVLADAPSKTAVPAQTDAPSPSEASAPVQADAAAPANGELTKRPLLFRISTLNGRTDVWLSAILMFKNEPVKLLTGTSPVFIIRDTQPYLSPDALNDVYPHMHSLPFQTITALGIPGLVLYAILLAYIAAHALRAFFCGADRMTLFERGVALIPLFYMVMDVVDISLWFAPPSSFTTMWFYIAAGYTVYLSQTRFPKKLFQKTPPACGSKEANA